MKVYLWEKNFWGQWQLKSSESLQKIDLNLYTDQNLEGHPEDFTLNQPFWIVKFGGLRGDDKVKTSNFYGITEGVWNKARKILEGEINFGYGHAKELPTLSAHNITCVICNLPRQEIFRHLICDTFSVLLISPVGSLFQMVAGALC